MIWDGCRSQQQKPRHTERCAEEFCLLPGLPAGTSRRAMPDRERAAGAGRPLLYFQPVSEQKGNGTQPGGSGGIPWLAVIPPVSARFARLARLARFIQRAQTPHNPDYPGGGGASKPAALDCFPLPSCPPASLPPSQHPNKRGPMAPWWLGYTTGTVTPGSPWNLRAKAKAFSAGISRIFLTGLPRRPKCSTVHGTAPLFLMPGAYR